MADLAILSGSGSQQFSDMGAVSVFIAHNSAVEARKKWLFSSQFTPFPSDRSDFFFLVQSQCRLSIDLTLVSASQHALEDKCRESTNVCKEYQIPGTVLFRDKRPPV